jgi:PAS domain S-box-containing protein
LRLQIKKEKDLKYNQSLIGNIYDAIITTDLEFNIIKWNSYAEKLFLYKENEVIGKNLFSTLKIKDENNQLQEIINQFNQNKKWVGELINHDKNGREIFVEVSASILTDENNQTIGNVSVILDITDNKFNESTLEQHSKSLEIELQRKLEDLTIINERLLLISKATNDAIWDWKIGTDRIWGNESYLNLLDQKDSDFINYNYFISKIHEDDRQLLNSNFNKYHNLYLIL